MRSSTSGLSVGIITALIDPEFLSAHDNLLAKKWQIAKDNELENANISTWKKVIGNEEGTIYATSIGSAGQAIAATETSRFLYLAKPDVLILCGIAGSLKKEKVLLEDVVIARNVAWSEFDKFQDGDVWNCVRAIDRPVSNRTTDFENYFALTLNQQNMLGNKSHFTVHYGDVFTWNYVAHSERTTDYINNRCSTALCVEMEAGGFSRAVDRFSSSYDNAERAAFVVRGISDFTVDKAKDQRVRERASSNAFETSIELAELIFDESRFDIHRGIRVRRN